MRDARRALLQLGDQLGDVIGQRDGLCEPSLLGLHRGQLGLESRDIGLVLRKLRRNLGPDLGEHEIQRPFAEHVLLDVLDERVLDLGHRLVHGHRAHRTAAVMVLRTAVAEHALVRTAVRDDTSRTDCTAARAALRDAAQRVLADRATAARARTTRGELLVDREPRRVIDDPPLGDIRDDHLGRVGFDAYRATALAHLLDAAMHVDAAIARVQKNRAHRARRPRAASATSCGRRRHGVVVQLMSDLLEAAPHQVLAIDALDDGRLLLVDHGDGEVTASAVRFALQLVTVASAARDSALTHAAAQTLAGARADRLQLHLVARTLDERGRLIDRVRELHFLACRVVVEVTATIAHQVANDERHFDRVATQARLITTDDQVAALRLYKQLTKSRARQEVVARAAIVDVLDARRVGVAHALDHFLAALELHVEAELLLAFVVLRASAVRANDHGFLNIPDPAKSSCQARFFTTVRVGDHAHRDQLAADDDASERAIERTAVSDGD